MELLAVPQLQTSALFSYIFYVSVLELLML